MLFSLHMPKAIYFLPLLFLAKQVAPRLAAEETSKTLCKKSAFQPIAYKGCPGVACLRKCWVKVPQRFAWAFSRFNARMKAFPRVKALVKSLTVAFFISVIFAPIPIPPMPGNISLMPMIGPCFYHFLCWLTNSSPKLFVEVLFFVGPLLIYAIGDIWPVLWKPFDNQWIPSRMPWYPVYLSLLGISLTMVYTFLRLIIAV